MTATQRLLSRKYTFYKTLTNLWFVGAVWLYFYRIFITDQQVGILDGMAFAIGLIAEVPSGALADKFGRSKIVRIGHVLAGTGLIMQGLGSSFVPFFVGQAILMVGVSFASGADEALFFQKLKFRKDSVEWRKLVTKGAQGALLGSLVAIVAGGWLHSINPRIPWILTGLTFIGAAILIWTIKDEKIQSVKKSLSSELTDYLVDIRTGFHMFRLPRLFLYVPLIVIVQGLFYAVGWGLLRLILLDRFHFDPFWGSVAVASSSLITVGVLAFMHKYAERMSEKRVLTVIALSAASSLLLAIANVGIWGYFIILTLYIGEFTLQPFMSEILNNNTSEKKRATVLSVASFLRTLPYVFLAPLIGFLNTKGELEYFLILWSVLIVFALFFYLGLKKRDETISVEDML